LNQLLIKRSILAITLPSPLKVISSQKRVGLSVRRKEETEDKEVKECREKKEIIEEEITEEVGTAEIFAMKDPGVITETIVKKDQDTKIAKTEEGKGEEVETLANDHSIHKMTYTSV
jgi:hypothetical protein